MKMIFFNFYFISNVKRHIHKNVIWTYFSSNFWHVKIEPNSINGLNKASAIDTLQLRGVDLQRFIRKLGSVSEIKMLEIIASIATVIEFEV